MTDYYRKYAKSEHGKEVRRKAQARYYEKNKEKCDNATKAYYQTPEGKAKKAEQNRRYREKMKRLKEVK